ncbi:MAG: AmmeMemoRadiSam system radical SAM enzyme [Planctomycetes bacterium]|nr:AmmeMemoRadiSam system radical SAM enzyme [Planctomycetota bacterium]
MTTLGDLLAERTREGVLYEKLPENRVRCFACGHRCKIPEGKPGICKVRSNRGGTLLVPTGYVGALQVDPTEKKPFFHALPGSIAMSFGMLGCDFHCGYCQNWLTSQALRDPGSVVPPRDITPEHMIQLARRHHAQVIATTYNEPLITSEWAVEIFRLAKPAGFRCAYVSNGNGTPEVLEYIRPWVDLYKVDLKSFRDRHYRELGGVLENVLETVRRLHRTGFWVEIVTLTVPGFNDSNEELRDIARFLVGISPDIPWHVTAFHQDYRMLDREDTPVKTLLRAAEIGKEAGLHYVYAGNRPGSVGPWENTYCPGCRALLIERFGFRVLQNRLADGSGCCPDCGRAIAGVWS